MRHPEVRRGVHPACGPNQSPSMLMTESVYGCHERAETIWNDELIPLAPGPKRRAVVRLVGYLGDPRHFPFSELLLEETREPGVDEALLTPVDMSRNWRLVVLAHHPGMPGPDSFTSDPRSKQGIENPCSLHVGPYPALACDEVV